MLDLKPGTLVADRFRLVRPLGRGGMGVVWVAHDERLQTPCAIKFLLAALDDRARARFALEARAAAQLRSPNVVSMLDHGEAGELPYIAMELLDGEDLAARLARVGRLPPARTLAIVEQIARALSRAHAAEMVHRDLKPANVFLVRDEDREVVKVLDFGIAKVHPTSDLRAIAASSESVRGESSPPKQALSMTATGTSMGTPNYMSPEQIEGAAIDARADLWALAVVAYECLTGRLPFQADSLAILVGRVLFTTPDPPSMLVQELPRSVDAFFERGLAKDRAQRFASARELSDALARALSEAPRATSTTADGGASTLAAEPPGLASAGVTVLLADTVVDPIAATVAIPTPSENALSAGLAATVRQDVPAVRVDGGPLAAPPQPRRSRRALLVGAAVALAGLLGVGLFTSVGRVGSGGPSDQVAASNSSDEATSSSPVLPPATSQPPWGSASLPPFVPGSSEVVEVAAGSHHTCARLASGAVTCWGRAYDGQFGVALSKPSAPVMLPDVVDAVAVRAAGVSTCILRQGGSLTCLGTLRDRMAPFQGIDQDVATFGMSMAQGLCVVKTTGKVRCIAGIDADKDAEGHVAGLDDATSVAVGQSHACALRRGGRVVCWGDGAHFKLAGMKTARELVPRDVGLTEVVELTAGPNMTCARTRAGAVLCWGDPSDGQLGSKDYREVVERGQLEGQLGERIRTPEAVPPAPVLGLVRADEVDVGSRFACATSAGALRCWGSNEHARLGRGRFGSPSFKIGSTPPPPEVVLTNVKYATLGEAHACALLDSGEVHCWGRNTELELGVVTQEVCERAIPCATRPVRTLAAK